MKEDVIRIKFREILTDRLGVKIEGIFIPMLCFADGIVVIATSEEYLQTALNVISRSKNIV